MEEVTVLQVGMKNLSKVYIIPRNVRWVYIQSGQLTKEKLKNLEVKKIQCTIVDFITSRDLSLLIEKVEAWTLFFTENVFLLSDIQKNVAVMDFFKSKMAYPLQNNELQSFITSIPRRFFDRVDSLRIETKHIEVARKYQNIAVWRGNNAIEIVDNFGEKYTPVMFWRFGMPAQEYRDLSFWAEYITEGSVQVKFIFRKFRLGSTDEVLQTVEVANPREPMLFRGDEWGGTVNISLQVKGSGTLRMGVLHARTCRNGSGEFFAGGVSTKDAFKEEVLSYFNPMDLRPPLNIYFSGYRMAEGFEGYMMLKNMGCPFLLISDPRLEGGAFYLGSKEYEENVEKVIRDAMEYLHFDGSQVLMSGISMGSFGAVYYGRKIEPKAIFLGKPLLNIGTIAMNEQTVRPEGFPTSLDLLYKLEGEVSISAAKRLNQRIWKELDVADFSQTEIAAVYMQQDDYDAMAYPDMLRHWTGKNFRVYGKGIIGRHNDNTNAVVTWFITQYQRILKEEFQRWKE